MPGSEKKRQKTTKRSQENGKEREETRKNEKISEKLLTKTDAYAYNG